MSESPILTSIPYLPLQEPVQVGPWTVTPLDKFEGRWAETAFETAARVFLGAFRTASGEPVRNPAIVVRDGVVSAVPPTAAEASALSRAIGLAVVDSNPIWTEHTRHHGYRMATSDNAELWIQPLDTIAGRIALVRGSRVRTTVGGYRVTDAAFAIPAPLELTLPLAADVDEVTANALYSVLTDSSESNRVGTAVDWLLKSWRNSTSISEDDRIVFLKTALEALTGTSKTQLAGSALRALFASTADQEGEGLGADALLWRPDEQILTRTWTANGKLRSAEVTELEHWYGALADARNDIIHEGTSGAGTYAIASSRYSGPIAEVADRVTREAILVAIGAAGYPDVWRKGFGRTALAAYRELSAKGEWSAKPRAAGD